MRTSQQAMKDAIDSGAVQAWIEGKPIQYAWPKYDWIDFISSIPSFQHNELIWRIKPIPQKPTVADWRPIKEIPRDGKRYLVRFNNGFVGLTTSHRESNFTTDSFGPPIYVSFAPLPE